MEILRSPKNVTRGRVSANFEAWVNILTTGILPKEPKRTGKSGIKIFASLKRIIQK